jgi:hypothetical protein
LSCMQPWHILNPQRHVQQNGKALRQQWQTGSRFLRCLRL